jgi:acetyltransferase
MSTHHDPSQNYLRLPPQPLDAVFNPKSIAVIGATETANSVGRTIMTNLMNKEYQGKIYPVNPKRSTIFDLKCYPSIEAIEDPIELAIIVTPAKTVPDIVSQCVRKKIIASIIISAGFKELGEEGIKLEQETLKRAREGNMRIIGPNCLGVMNPIIGLNATFAATIAEKGNIAFISQSGAMCTAVLDWSIQENVGYSAFVSIGSMADIHWGDLIDYLGHDPNTESILIYMETIGDARAFVSAAREVTLNKPIIVIKAGRTEAAAKAAASHTGSLAGSDDVFEAAMERSGVLRVNTISELFDLALVLAKQPRPKGPRLTIMTNAGGPGVLATDEAVSYGAEMATLRKETIEKLSEFLPEAWSHSNPVDILGDADPELYAKSIEVVIKDPDTDGLLVILSPQAVTDPTGTAQAIKDYAHLFPKPIFASWMGGASIAEGLHILNNAGIPAFIYPDNASKAFGYMWHFSKNLAILYETPSELVEISTKGESKQEKVKKIIEAVKKEGRTLLTEFESKQLLSAYDIPIVETIIAQSPEEAAEAAKQLKFPVVLKVNSETITHKMDVGGVKLNLQDEASVKEAFKAIKSSVTQHVGAEHFHGVTVQKMIKLTGYELIIGSSTDPQFGPVILFGSGGSLVEVYKDKALGLPPLTDTLSLHLIKKTKVYTALLGVRGQKGIDIEKLKRLLVNFSHLISEHPWIKECDINPLLASPEGLIALDARILLHDLDLKEEELPKVAIRPYPVRYVFTSSLKDGRAITIRPIRPEDEPLIVEFHREICEESVRQRYLEFVSLDKRIAHERLIRMCCVDYDRCVALVAEIEDKGKKKEIIGVIRVSKIPGTDQADFAMIIADRFHNQGLGTLLLEQAIDMAKKENIKLLTALILKDNEVMLHLCKKYHFTLTPSSEVPGIVEGQLRL